MALVSWRVDKADAEQASALKAAGWLRMDASWDGDDPNLETYTRDIPNPEAALYLADAVPQAKIIPSVDLPLPYPTQLTALAPPGNIIAWPSKPDGELSAADAEERTKYLTQVVALAGEMVTQAKVWRGLGIAGAVAVAAALGFSIFFIWKLIDKIPENNLNGIHLIFIVFTFAVFIISPGVLLILGRPLKSLDEWTPDGILKSDKPGDDKAKEPNSEDPKKGSGGDS
ncbi:MAG: hypothetical protein WAX14_14080 [Rhodococcus sp. (in: high G+C Gram-positive bacteria)]|uniref:hypothetical protein n=1 Tax=Rhodococcus sp. TaxID=1831 RepID=UPI003BB7CB40